MYYIQLCVTRNVYMYNIYIYIYIYIYNMYYHLYTIRIQLQKVKKLLSSLHIIVIPTRCNNVR